MKDTLLKRLTYLWSFEFLNAGIIIPGLIWSLSLNLNLGILTISTTFMVCLLLITGSLFWYLKYLDVKHSTKRLKQWQPFFRTAQIVYGLGLLLFFSIFSLTFRSFTPNDIFIGVSMYILAILEYINYFYVQLMYDNRHDLQYLLQHRQLKKGIIAREYQHQT